MPLAVKGLLLSLLGVLDIVSWFASPQGWLIASYTSVYLVVADFYSGFGAIALATAVTTITTLLLFPPDQHLS